MTDQQKAPVLVAASAEGHIISSPLHSKPLSPRLQRLLRALIANPGGLSREDCDRATPCSNSPEYVSQLRHRLGLEIACSRVPFETCDGLKSSYGWYRLTAADRTKLDSEGLA